MGSSSPTRSPAPKWGTRPPHGPGPHRRYSLSSLLLTPSGKVRYEELGFLTRGSRALGSMAGARPVPDA